VTSITIDGHCRALVRDATMRWQYANRIWFSKIPHYAAAPNSNANGFAAARTGRTLDCAR